MKSINQTAKQILDHLILGMDLSEHSHRKFDNSAGTFTALTVEIIGACSVGNLVSICHYGEQNGDLMRDPEMCFIQDKTDGNFYPYYFRNDFAGREQNAVIFDDNGDPKKYYPGLQKELISFADMWLKNIKYQQKISIK